MLQRIAILGAGFLMAWVAAGAADNACEKAKLVRDQAVQRYTHGDLPSAIVQLQATIRSCPSEPFYEFMLANALYRAGKLQESAAHYQTFLAARPEHLEGRLSLGFTLFELGEGKRAVEQWRAAVRLDPKSPFAHAALAVGLYAAGDAGESTAESARASDLDPRYGDPDALAIDIRWKPAARAVLNEIIRHSASQGGH